MTEPEKPPISASPQPTAAEGPQLVEIGWVLVGRLTSHQRQSVQRAQQRVQERLSAWFPAYAFHFTTRDRPQFQPSSPAELIDLVDLGATERDQHHWDFAFVTTADDVRTYQKASALGAPASSLNVAAMSLWRLPPSDRQGSPPPATEELANRIEALFFHLFGHLNDLPHSGDQRDFMFPLERPEELDQMGGFSEAALAQLEAELAKEADLRVEEETARRGTAAFYLKATTRNFRDILQAVRKARPWLSIVRLSRFATSALSAMVVLLVTAEAWDLGLSQTPLTLFLGSITSIVLTASYVIYRQRLLRGGTRAKLTEHQVTARVFAVLSVLLAMASGYGCLFLVALAVTRILFSIELVAAWAASAAAPQGWEPYLLMSAMVAMLGIVLGALGASFEQEKYFRHLIILDEET